MKLNIGKPTVSPITPSLKGNLRVFFSTCFFSMVLFSMGS